MASFQWLGFSNQCNHSFRLSEIRAKKVISFRRYSVTCEERNSLGLEDAREDKKKLRLLIAGGGIGGLVLALAAKKRGYDVKVFEKDLSLVRGEGQHRGPIQLLSSALAVLEAIDEDVAKQIVDAGCVTGSRINGLADGLSGEWFTKYDLLTPAVSRGLPVTEVISRVTLQDILVNAVGMDIVSNTSKVVDFVQDSNKVKVVLEDGREHEGDVLVGADGIWSNVRAKLVGAQPANYSNYTCYSGYTSFVPPYIETVGYRVFLGLNKYFVASDVGSGKMQWYAFHKEAPMTNDPPGGKKERLLELFGNWCSEVVTLILETPEDMILKRDIYDRDMIYSWGNGRVTLLGDAAHPMQPNLGQGGCMAIEDCYQLIDELDKVPTSGSGAFLSTEIESALKRYEKERLVRVRIVHAATRIASRLLSYYEPYIYLGTGPLFGSSSWRFRHPGIHLARMIVQTFVPMYMSWMIAGHGVKPGIKGPFWQSFKVLLLLLSVNV